MRKVGVLFFAGSNANAPRAVKTLLRLIWVGKTRSILLIKLLMTEQSLRL